ncbi:sensor histidine kinase [Faecalimicrobium sp. JNUCC 81]
MNKKVMSIALVLVLFISFGSIMVDKKSKYDEINHKKYFDDLNKKYIPSHDKAMNLFSIVYYNFINKNNYEALIKFEVGEKELISNELYEKNKKNLRLLLVSKNTKASIATKIGVSYGVDRELKEIEKSLKKFKRQDKLDIYLNEKLGYDDSKIKWSNEYRNLINNLTSIKESQRNIKRILDVDLKNTNSKLKILQLQRTHLEYFVVFIIIIMLLVLIIIIHEYRKKKAKNEILSHNVEILNKQLDYQWKHYNDIKKHQDEVKRHWHDIKRHSFLILNLIENEEYQKAKDYIRSITEEISEVENKKVSKNKIIDAILSNKIEECNLKNINLTMDIKIPETLNINDFDICVIFGNILDNAIEACENINNDEIGKYIDIKSKLINKQLYIYIENSKEGDIIEKKNKFITSKKDKYNHGLGLENVKKSIEKYNGKIRINYDKNIFKLSILMKN